jgi:hypothetical protein
MEKSPSPKESVSSPPTQSQPSKEPSGHTRTKSTFSNLFSTGSTVKDDKPKAEMGMLKKLKENGKINEKTLDDNHILFNLAYAMMCGINISAGRSKTTMEEISMNEFMRIEHLTFPPGGSSGNGFIVSTIYVFIFTLFLKLMGREEWSGICMPGDSGSFTRIYLY